MVLAAGFLSGAALHDVHTVYIFPMRHALDQYLAARLTEEHVFQVVSDPKTADAVFTDRIGAPFERTFDERVLDIKSKTDAEAVHASFGGADTLFLVNRSKEVIWSDFGAPKDHSSNQMGKAARRSVDKLMKDLGLKTAKVTSQ